MANLHHNILLVAHLLETTSGGIVQVDESCHGFRRMNEYERCPKMKHMNG